MDRGGSFAPVPFFTVGEESLFTSACGGPPAVFSSARAKLLVRVRWSVADRGATFAPVRLTHSPETRKTPGTDPIKGQRRALPSLFSCPRTSLSLDRHHTTRPQHRHTKPGFSTNPDHVLGEVVTDCPPLRQDAGRIHIHTDRRLIEQQSLTGRQSGRHHDRHTMQTLSRTIHGNVARSNEPPVLR